MAKYISQTKEFPLFMRALHRAEAYCQEAVHAAYYLQNGETLCNGEFTATIIMANEASWTIRKVGVSFEDGYQECWPFELPNEDSDKPLSRELFHALLRDMKNAIRMTRKAITYLVDYKDRYAADIKQLRNATMHIYFIFKILNSQRASVLHDIECCERHAAKSSK